MNHRRANETFLAHFNQDLSYQQGQIGEKAWTHGGPHFSFGSKLPPRELNREENQSICYRDSLLFGKDDRQARPASASASGPSFGYRRETKMDQRPGPGDYKSPVDDRMQWQAVSFKGRRTMDFGGPRLGADSPGPGSYHTSCSTLGVAGNKARMGCKNEGRLSARSK